VAFACSTGDPEDDVDFENEGEGVSGVVESWNTFINVPKFTDGFIGVGEDFDPKLGVVLVVFVFSSKGVFDRKGGAGMARLDTRSLRSLG